MKRTAIENRIKEYIEDDNANYAVLIDGPWGCGKTYLYENYLMDIISKNEDKKDNGKMNVYISLYGIPTIEVLSKQLTTNYMFYVKNTTNNKDKKSLKTASGILGLVSKGVSLSIGGASFDFEKILESIYNMVDIKGMVICFDDFERCSIPINELLGFINNLVEHCDCKAIILADEQNIGRMYANTNLEMKYMTLLMGGRKLIFENQYDESGAIIKNKKIDDQLTLEQIKNINEKTFSENYVYKDIREKVIGIYMTYTPDLEEIIESIICSNEHVEKVKEVADEEFFWFLLSDVKYVTKCFREIDCQNLRIISKWIRKIKPIYMVTVQHFGDSEYFKDIIENFIRYSIWVVYSIEKSEKLIKWNNYSITGEVYFKNRVDKKITGYKFIDEWFGKDVWDGDELYKAAEQVILEKEKENQKRKVKVSMGIALKALGDWTYMEDEEISDTISLLISELKEGKYVFGDYHAIFDFLIYFKHLDLYKGDVGEIQKIMIEKINSSLEVLDIKYSQHTFSTEEEEREYEMYYIPVYELACKKNIELDKQRTVKLNIYENGEKFYSYCREKENYFASHKAFMEYINIDLLLELIRMASLKDLYTVIDAFRIIYDFSNVYEYYKSDVEKLKALKGNLLDTKLLQWNGRTREIARDTFVEYIESVINKIERKRS